MEQDQRPPTSSPRTGPGGEHFQQHHGPGSIRILAVVAAVVLLVTGRYPVHTFGFVLVAQIAVRTVREVFAIMPPDMVSTVVFNGHVDTIDPATGRKIQPPLISMRATREPVMPFSRADPRVVEAIDIVSILDQRPNLLDLSPKAFESFVQNLFTMMGYETDQYRSSNDGGID